jgi:hypothetical protein
VVPVDLPDVDGRVVETLARPDARRVPGVAALLAALRAAASAGAQEPVEHPDAEAQ